MRRWRLETFEAKLLSALNLGPDRSLGYDDAIDAHHDHRRQYLLPVGRGSYLFGKCFGLATLEFEAVFALLVEKVSRLSIRNVLIAKLFDRL